MNTRTTAVAILAAMLMIVAVPWALSDESDAASESDILISVDGGGSDIEVEINTLQPTTVVLYVTNTSGTYYSLDVFDLDLDVLETSSSVTVLGSSGNILYPADDRDGRHIAVVTIDITPERLADTQTVTDTVVLRFIDLEDTSGDGTNYFDVGVELTATIHSVYTSDDSYNKFFGLIPNTLPSPFNSPAVTAAATLILWILATIIVCELVIPLLTRFVGNRKTDVEKKRLTNTLTKTISVLMFVVAVNECLNIIGASAEIMSLVATWSMVLYVIIGAVLSWQVYIFLVTAVINGLDDAMDVNGIDASLIPLFKMIGKLIICVIAVTIIMAAFGVDLAGIMVSAGVVTLGITFGAQEIISQFFSGIVLLSTRPFKKGDFVSLNGTTYVVRKVKLMFTEFENWDRDQIVTMPNNAVTSATMINYTKDSPNTRIFVYVTVSYEADVSLAKELMLKAAQIHPHVVKDRSVLPPSTRLTNFLDSGIEYRLACFVDDYDNSAHYAGQLREIIYKLFKDNGIELSISKLEVELNQPCDGKRRPYDNEPDV